LSPTTPIALSMNTYGTNNATSQSGDESVIDPAISEASVNASAFVCGFNFQLPDMNGFLKMKRDDSSVC